MTKAVEYADFIFPVLDRMLIICCKFPPLRLLSLLIYSYCGVRVNLFRRVIEGLWMDVNQYVHGLSFWSNFCYPSYNPPVRG